MKNLILCFIVSILSFRAFAFSSGDKIRCVAKDGWTYDAKILDLGDETAIVKATHYLGKSMFFATEQVAFGESASGAYFSLSDLRGKYLGAILVDYSVESGKSGNGHLSDDKGNRISALKCEMKN